MEKWNNDLFVCVLWGVGCGWGLDVPYPQPRNEIVTPRHSFHVDIIVDDVVIVIMLFLFTSISNLNS